MELRTLISQDAVKINDMDASQYIGKAWREVNGVRKLVEIDYFDPTWPNGYEHHYKSLLNTIEAGGVAIGAFESGNLIGFITVNSEIYGVESRYVLLDQLFVSKPFRGKGLGKKLFAMAVEHSKMFKADKFLICAGSAEETIAFYKAIGCVDALEVNQELFDEDPRDIQLEYNLQI